MGEPVYQAEIDTLRDMLVEERASLTKAQTQLDDYQKEWGTVAPSKGLRTALANAEARVEALTTAIEALGGAL